MRRHLLVCLADAGVKSEGLSRGWAPVDAGEVHAGREFSARGVPASGQSALTSRGSLKAPRGRVPPSPADLGEG